MRAFFSHIIASDTNLTTALCLPPSEVTYLSTFLYILHTVDFFLHVHLSTSVFFNNYFNFLSYYKWILKSGRVACTSNPSTQEADVRGDQARGEPGWMLLENSETTRK